ncbi:hypothetical protein DOTSEDRAFT_73413 [Dothistroma septosporum NZE10]|uniref:DUF1993 domain-containing protein n=1 Tax=Dothistroma septosporum (strain NZE10 / CBS 128990) TaxID=675120 RepID=N1PIY3_DOTSN|nr:hypothetical protein DOTSEDRAFT_73413 [Dothistroma septosporum NZE10]
MSLNLYDLSVPIFLRALENLKTVLQVGQTWAKDNNVDEKKLIEGRIIEDMKPLPFQIHSCCNNAKGILHLIGGEEAAPVPDNEKTFDEFLTRIDSTIAVLEKAQRGKFVDPAQKITLKIGPRELEFEAIKYLTNFAIPNFFFHHTAAYMILRKEGVNVGKLDYLGGKDLTTA